MWLVSCNNVLGDCSHIKTGQGAINTSLYGQQDSAEPNISTPGLYGKKQPGIQISDTVICSTQTGIGVNQTIMAIASRPASFCGRNLITSGMMHDAARNSASSARTAHFQLTNLTETTVTGTMRLSSRTSELRSAHMPV